MTPREKALAKNRTLTIIFLLIIVDIECTCSNCGKTTSFTQKFTVGRIDDKGNYHESDINSSVKKFFR